MDGMGWTDEWPRNGDGDGAELGALNARERECWLSDGLKEEANGRARQGTSVHSSWGLVVSDWLRAAVGSPRPPIRHAGGARGGLSRGAGSTSQRTARHSEPQRIAAHEVGGQHSTAQHSHPPIPLPSTRDAPHFRVRHCFVTRFFGGDGHHQYLRCLRGGRDPACPVQFERRGVHKGDSEPALTHLSMPVIGHQKSSVRHAGVR